MHTTKDPRKMSVATAIALTLGALSVLAPTCDEPEDSSTRSDAGASDLGGVGTSGTPEEVDTDGNVGLDNEIAFVDGRPHIVFYDWNSAQADLKHAERRDDGWHVEVLLADNRHGNGVSRPAIIAYEGQPLVITAKRSGANYSLVALERNPDGGWHETVLDPGADTADTYEALDYADIEIFNGEPVVAYTTHGEVDALRMTRYGSEGWTNPVDIAVSTVLAPNAGADHIREPALVQTSGGIAIIYLVSSVQSAAVSWEEQGGWTSAILQEGRASYPDARTFQSQPILVWGSEEFDGEWHYFTRMVAGGPEVWENTAAEPEMLAPPGSDPQGQTGKDPCLAVIGDRLVVVYARVRNGYERLAYAISEAEGGWEYVVFEESDEYITASEYLSCASSEGRIAVAWYGLNGHLWYLDDLLAAGDAL